MAQSVEHVTLDLGIVSSSPTLSDFIENKILKNNGTFLIGYSVFSLRNLNFGIMNCSM